MTTTTIFCPEYVDLLGGDVLSALMLSQIVYWYLPSKKTGKSKLRVCKTDSGKEIWWLAKSHVDWTNELHFTRRQAQRCIGVLEEAGIITTKLYRFNGLTTLHIRLTFLNGGDSIAEPPSAKALKSTPEDAQSTLACTSDVPSQHPHVLPLTGTTTEITTTTKTGVQKQHATPDEKTPEKTNEEEGVTVKETLEVLKGKTQISPTMESHWRQGLALLSKEYHPPLTTKDKAQLKRLGKLLGDEKFRVVDWCLENWGKFASPAAAQAGLATYPTKPNIGFLLKHHAYAVNRLQSIAESGLEDVTVGASPVTTKVVQKLVNTVEEPYKPSPEEFEKLLAELQE